MRSAGSSTTRSACAFAALAVIASPLLAQGAGGAANNPYLHFTQEHGFTFSTIGGPPSVNISGRPPIQQGPPVTIRGVDHAYRISTRETTVAQYFEFVQAAAPFIRDLGGSNGGLAGQSLGYGGSVGGVPQYFMQPGTENLPALSAFGYFAMMANWLHHGAPSRENATIDTFRTGAYNDFVNQPTRNEGARFWIPSSDEWHKAVYWDPNKDGQGNGGYWLFPDASDDPLIPGRPEDGAQTGAGAHGEWPQGIGDPPLGVGLYPDTQTPWGLLDASGGAREWTETIFDTFIRTKRFVEGSQARYPGLGLVGDLLLQDNIFEFKIGDSFNSIEYVTARFAAAVPAPGVPGVAAVALLAASTRKRRCSQTSTELQYRRQSH